MKKQKLKKQQPWSRVNVVEAHRFKESKTQKEWSRKIKDLHKKWEGASIDFCYMDTSGHRYRQFVFRGAPKDFTVDALPILAGKLFKKWNSANF